MNNSKTKFRHGTMKLVAEKLGISHQAAIQRVHRGNMEALQVALDIQEAANRERASVQKRIAKISAP
jgi:hypothetical protein